MKIKKKIKNLFKYTVNNLLKIFNLQLNKITL